MNLRRAFFALNAFAVFGFGWVGTAWAGSATNVTGLYYTGVDNSGAALGNGVQDGHWTVTYARVGGTAYTGNSTYTGSAYVVSSNYIDGAWVQNSSSYRWITAPGASTATSGGTTNVGGDFLPGNGTTGTNSAHYVYRLAFTISGTGSGTVTNNIQISMTTAADDAYRVYVNPASAPTVNNSGVVNAGGTAVSASGTSAWNNTTSFTLGNSTPTAARTTPPSSSARITSISSWPTPTASRDLPARTPSTRAACWSIRLGRVSRSTAIPCPRWARCCRWSARSACLRGAVGAGEPRCPARGWPGRGRRAAVPGSVLVRSG